MYKKHPIAFIFVIIIFGLVCLSLILIRVGQNLETQTIRERAIIPTGTYIVTPTPIIRGRYVVVINQLQ